jgi:hypothetical protein
MSSKNEPDGSKADRYHSEARESVDAVLGRMCEAIGVDPTWRGYAEALDISKETIKTWRRRGEVSMRFLVKFSAEHGVALDYLRRGRGDPKDVGILNPVGVSEGGQPIRRLPRRVPGVLTEREVLTLVLDALHAVQRSLPAERIYAAVDAFLALQRAGAPVTKSSVVEQLRLVK